MHQRARGLSVLLVIDVGNTETVIGLYARGEADAALDPEESVGVGIGTETDPNAPRGLTHHWRLSTVSSRTPDEHAVLLTQLLDLEGLDIANSVTGIAVSSSVPHVTGELRQMAQRWFSQLPCVVLGPGTNLYGGPCVVVDMGTATTVEAISAAGEYLGGAITPGVAISLEALYQHAAALRRVEMVEPRHVIGRSTVESIESGTLYGFAAQVDGLARRFMEELGPSTVVATGGLSALIAPHSDTIEHVEPWLTLHGLRIVYDRNVSGGQSP